MYVRCAVRFVGRQADSSRSWQAQELLLSRTCSCKPCSISISVTNDLSNQSVCLRRLRQHTAATCTLNRSLDSALLGMISLHLWRLHIVPTRWSQQGRGCIPWGLYPVHSGLGSAPQRWSAAGSTPLYWASPLETCWICQPTCHPSPPASHHSFSLLNGLKSMSNDFLVELMFLTYIDDGPQ